MLHFKLDSAKIQATESYQTNSSFLLLHDDYWYFILKLQTILNNFAQKNKFIKQN